MPIDFDNLGGKHAWVSGSTIKYVNMWLEEGAARLHFTNYEFFPSIELSSLADRIPYVSYPTGVTFMVWLAAKISGQSRIDIGFLKHYQLIIYGIENIILAVTVYCIISRNLKYTEKIKTIASLLAGIFWMTIPINNWFLSNIYWTDIAVFLWIVAFLLLETLSDTHLVSGKGHYIIIGLKSIVIFCGVLTEYYFWIIVFTAFVLNFCGKKNLFDTIKNELQYVIPVVIGILVYIWQLSYTNDWLSQLSQTFFHRTGANSNESGLAELMQTFMEAIACGSYRRMILLICVYLLSFIWITFLLIMNRQMVDISNITDNKSWAVIVIMIVTPIVQILIFSNHSAIHMYSMTKIGIHLVGMVVMLSICSLYYAGNKKAVICNSAVLTVISACLLLALGYPDRIKGFYYTYNKEEDYSIDKAIYGYTDYNDVCFSLTYAVSNNPPMDISVSEKAVYLIESLEDINMLFPNLPQEAKKILVIDKNNIGSKDYIDREKTENIIKMEGLCARKGVCVYEDDTCMLIDISHM